MNSTLTPIDKRNLEAVREFTPIKNDSKAPFRDINSNRMPNPNLIGNTVTKSKKSCFASPLSRTPSSKFEKENFNNTQYFRRTPDRGNYWDSDWNRNSTKRPQRSYSNFNGANSTFSAPRNKTYGYNPNFRPKYRK